METRRVQVNLSEDMIQKLDRYAKAIGVPRATLCSVLIGQGVLGFDKSFELLDKVANDELMSIKGGQETQ